VLLGEDFTLRMKLSASYMYLYILPPTSTSLEVRGHQSPVTVGWGLPIRDSGLVTSGNAGSIPDEHVLYV
jgi:hypothetical protein